MDFKHARECEILRVNGLILLITG